MSCILEKKLSSGNMETQRFSFEDLPPTSFSFVQLADPQLGIGGYEHDVATFRQAVRELNRLRPDFVVICGDLIHERDDVEAMADFKAIKAGLKMPCYCVPGNHDVHNEPNARTLSRYRALNGADRFSIEHKGHVLVGVNSQLWKAPLQPEAEQQDAWMLDVLQAAARRELQVVIAGHTPLYTEHPEEEEHYFNLPLDQRARLLDLFEEFRVKAYLAGHAHKNIAHSHRGIELITTASTSCNFDAIPMGYRMWRVQPAGDYSHAYVALSDQAEHLAEPLLVA